VFALSEDTPAKRNLNGWYDTSIVTRRGEDYLADLDEYAVKLFRKKGMFFSKRRDDGAKFDGFFELPISGSGIVGHFAINDVDAMKIKLFGLSLLWRASATSRPEFEHIKLAQADEKSIGRFITGDATPRHWEYPIIVSAFDNSYDRTDLTPSVVRMFHTKFIRWCIDGVILYTCTRRTMFNRRSMGALSAGYLKDELKGLVINYSSSTQKKVSDRVFENHLEKFGSPYRDDKMLGLPPKFVFDEFGRRVPFRNSS
tara:strand:- start:192 stop:959 length:768 start_codon:yes stop_codon:yes gene_type:complete